MKKVYKYGTGQELPDGAVYLWSCKNGWIDVDRTRAYIWHYFLVEVD